VAQKVGREGVEEKVWKRRCGREGVEEKVWKRRCGTDILVGGVRLKKTGGRFAAAMIAGLL
jgi:hypothetical protein